MTDAKKTKAPKRRRRGAQYKCNIPTPACSPKCLRNFFPQFYRQYARVEPVDAEATRNRTE